MTRQEAISIVDKIQVYRQSFLITNRVYEEWYKVLEPYDYEDVDRKLDEYFKDGDNFGRYPDVYYLTKYLRTSDEKLKVGINYCRCQICGATVDYKLYDNHFERCNSTTYLCEISLRYNNQKLNFKKLIEAEKETFENYYWNLCENVVKKMQMGLERHMLENAIATHYGKSPSSDISDIIKEMN